MLCEALSKIELNGAWLDYFHAGSPISVRWALHKEKDRKREAARQAEEKARSLRQQALKKLSDEEREALGIREG
jgi:hypothetical protein